MEILVQLLLVLLIIFFSLLLLILIIPIDYGFLAGISEKIFFKGSVKGWKVYSIIFNHSDGIDNVVFTLLGFTFNTFSYHNKRDAINNEMTPTLNKKKSKRNNSRKNSSLILKEMLDNIPFFKTILKTGVDIVNIVKPKIFTIKGRVGFDEPHYTGMLLGMLSLLPVVNKNFVIDIQPSWQDQSLEGGIEAAGRIVLLIIAAKILKLLLSKQGIKFFLTVGRKKNSKLLQPNFLMMCIN
ncbi:MAG: hypothetical protein ACOYVD_19555 [Bacillota bacterium]